MNIKPFHIRKTIWPAVIAGQHYGGPELATIKDLACKALNLPLQDLSFPNFTDIAVSAADPGIYPADA